MKNNVTFSAKSKDFGIIMRIKLTKIAGFIVLLANFIVIYYSLRLFHAFGGPVDKFTVSGFRKPSVKPAPNKQHISKSVTIVIREFESLENDVSATVQSFLNLFPTIHVIIIFDVLPYPPLNIFSINNTLKNVRGVNLKINFKIPFEDRNPLVYIKTKYVLFVPDSTRVSSRQTLQAMLTEIMKEPKLILATSTSTKKELECLRINVNVREWTLKYSHTKFNECDAINGKHLILMDTDLLRKLPDAFAMPFPRSLYIQTAFQSIKVKVFRGVSFQESRNLQKSHHALWKQKQVEAKRLKSLYEHFQLKQVVRETGTTEW